MNLQVRARWQTFVRFMLTRPPEKTSPLGVLIQFGGIGCLVYGIFQIHPPTAFIAGGVLCVLGGERL